MTRPVLFLLSSIGAHFVALVFLGGQLGDAPSTLSVFHVDAVPRPLPPLVEPAPTDLEPEPEPEPEPEQEPPRARRRQRPLASAPVPTPLVDEPSALVEEPSAPDGRDARDEQETTERPEPQPGPMVTPIAPLSITPAGLAGTSSPTARVGASSRPHQPHRSGARAGRDPSGGGGAGRVDPCDEVRLHFARRMVQVAPYPQWAQQLQLEGNLRLSFRIGRDGHPRGVRVVSGTGHAGLDRYAVTAARRVGGLPSSCSRLVAVSVAYRSPRRR